MKESSASVFEKKGEGRGRNLKDPVVKYQLLLKINNAIITQRTRDGLFQALASEFSKLFHYDRFSINLYHEETNSLSYFAGAYGINPKGINERTRPVEKGSIAQMVIQTRKPVFIYDISQNLQLATAPSMVKAGLNSSLAYPMIIRDTILGSIHFSFKQVPDNIYDLREFLNDLSVQVAIAVDNILSYNRLKGAIESLEREKNYLLNNDDAAGKYPKDQFCYMSHNIARLMEDVERVAATDATVLITGETGTGKGHLARTIHTMSSRKDRLFVKVNCAALTPSLIESELFGHAKGAFTGAEVKRVGRFEMADGGTVFLDEIGELPLNTQVKLLQVLQEKTFERVGESSPVAVDIRIIAATNQNLKQKIKEKTFRSDLFYRLNNFNIHIPPLRERTEDIAMLVDCFTNRYAEKLRRPMVRYTSSAMEALCRYQWSGNVRELENVIERLMILRAGTVITREYLQGLLNTSSEGPHDEVQTKDEMETQLIKRALLQSGGVVGGPKGAAKILGMRRTTLQYRMKKLDIDANHFPSISNPEPDEELGPE